MSQTPSIIVEHDIPVRMRDGVVLYGDLYRPATGRHPTLIMRTPYSKGLPIGLMVVLSPLRAAAAGYSVFIQDVRGRFKSEGDFVPFANEAEDGFDTVEWAAAQPWSTGRVGMFGSSYMAATQLRAATTAPPHLQAICPMEGSADFFEGRSYKGGTFELGSLLSIALFALGTGNIERAKLGKDEFRKHWRETKALLDDLPKVAATAPLTALRETVIGAYAPFFFDWLEHDEPGAYWESISISPGHDQIAVPALHLSSWYDNFCVGAINNYLGIRSKGATATAREHQYLWLGPWGHYMPRTALNGAARLGVVDFGLDALIDLDSMQLAWFDRWLKDDMTSWRFNTPVRLFVLGANRWRDEQAWPVAHVEERLFLAGGGELRSRAPESSPPDAYRSDPDNPVPTIGGAHLILESAFPQGPWDQRSAEMRDDVLVYSSEVLAEDLEVVGNVSLDVWVRSSAPSTDIAATLSVVKPDGPSVNVLDGIRRTTLAPGEPAKVEVFLGPIAQTFRRGERIRLRICGSNFPRHDINPQTGERSFSAKHRVAAAQEIFHDPDHLSALRLPIVRGGLP